MHDEPARAPHVFKTLEKLWKHDAGSTCRDQRRLIGVCLFAILVSPAVQGQSLSGGHSEESTITSSHEIKIQGNVLHYTAKAGLVPIRDNETGEVHGNMFFVAYTLDQAPGSKVRPLTFVWNGGPGSNSGLVHLLGFGPKRITTPHGSALDRTANARLVDNQETWLAFTDLVFVDPIGTGYSRPTKREYASEFYQTRGDGESVAEFIRVYLTRHDMLEAPLFIAGESYGVARCAVVADALERRHTHLQGVIMISGGFPLAKTKPELRAALTLPTFTAAAYYNKKLPPDLQAGTLQKALRAAEVYAQNDYSKALSEIGDLSEAERDAVVAQLVRFTGLAAKSINRATLRVTIEQFSSALLASQKLMVGRYDSRLVGPLDPSPQYDPTKDPSLKDILDSVAVIRYLRNELRFKSDLLYQGPFGGGYPPPSSFRGDWMSIRWKWIPANTAENAGEYPAAAAAATAFRQAMIENPKLRVLVATGIYDLLGSYLGIDYAVRNLPSEFAGRVTARTYESGHALYTDAAARQRFQVDAATFIKLAEAK